MGYVALDIDHLARLNQAFGLGFGYRVSRGTGAFLARRVPNLIAAGRMSGGGFGILLRCTGQESLQFRAQKLVQCLSTDLLQLDRRALVTASAGATLLAPSQRSVSIAIADAERAMIHAKNNGRNQLHLCPLAEPHSDIGMQLGRQLQEALHQNRLVLGYQPVVDAQTGTAAYHECLLRLDDGLGTLVPAAQLVPVAEDVGLVRAIDRWVLDRVASELAAYCSARLALNVSAFSINDPAWVERLEALARLHPGIANRLTIEITETAAMLDVGVAIAFSRRVQSIGVRVALDDFGAGYTSFAHLRDLSVDMVKIDGRFTRNLNHSPENRLMLAALLQLAKGFGIETVAECAETAEDVEDVEALAGAGTTYIQGYYFGRPDRKRLPAPTNGEMPTE